jgi:isopentenyldiphosphate isomerase/intracellular septation protein A
MNPQQPLQLLKKLLPGLLPILVFIIVDEIWGTKAGLIVAVTFGVAELGYTWLREKRFDRFVVFDTALLVVMGGISIWLDNDIFFKLKPAFINVILCAVLGLSAFSKKNLILLYSQRYFKEVEINPEQEKMMQGMFRALFWIIAAQTLLVVYSAYFMSKETWAFISGGLLYILFLLFFGWQYLSNRFKMKKLLKNEEWVPLVDETGNITGKATRTLVHSKPGMLHPVVHLHVFNHKGELFLQKRPLSKDVEPGKWDTAVGGHISFGEKIEAALEREVQEEIGIAGYIPQAWARYRWDSAVESELIFTFVTKYEGEIMVNTDEVDDGKFWTISEIEKWLGRNIFTPNFEKEYAMMKERKIISIL